MKKLIIWVAAGAVIIAAVGFGVYQVVFKEDKTSKTTTSEVKTGEQADAGATKTACDIYTDDIAKQVLGEGARKSDPVPAADASTDDVSVTNCTYEQGDANTMSDIAVANVLVRGGKTSTGISSNELGFENNKTLDAEGGNAGTSEDISGIGDAAYYSPAFEQVNVLVDGGTYWLIVQAETRDQAEKLAKLLTEQLQ